MQGLMFSQRSSSYYETETNTTEFETEISGAEGQSDALKSDAPESKDEKEEVSEETDGCEYSTRPQPKIYMNDGTTYFNNPPPPESYAPVPDYYVNNPYMQPAPPFQIQYNNPAGYFYQPAPQYIPPLQPVPAHSNSGNLQFGHQYPPQPYNAGHYIPPQAIDLSVNNPVSGSANIT